MENGHLESLSQVSTVHGGTGLSRVRREPHLVVVVVVVVVGGGGGGGEGQASLSVL